MKIRHHIIVKWNEDVKNKKALVPDIQKLFEKTLDIPGIVSVECIENVIDRKNRYDLIVAIDMYSEALSVYDQSEAHHQWKDQYGPLIASKAIFDSEID